MPSGKRILSVKKHGTIPTDIPVQTNVSICPQLFPTFSNKTTNSNKASDIIYPSIGASNFKRSLANL
jgi:hypothetical protein